MQQEQDKIEIFEHLFKARKRFERFAMLYITDRDEVQDILMESYAYMWEHRAEIDFSGNVEAYMFNVVKHRCLDYLDHASVRQNAENSILTDAQWELDMSISTLRAFDPAWLYDSDVRRRIRQIVGRMPETTRRIFTMSRIEHKSYRQIAEEVGLSVKSVEFHVSRALKYLRENLGDYFLVILIFRELLGTIDRA